MTIYSDLQKLQSVLKRISYAELLLKCRWCISTEGKCTARCTALVPSGLNWNAMGGRGRKHQRKRDIPFLEGRGQKCDEEERKLEENEEEMKQRKQSQQTKILNLQAKY